MPLQGPTNDHKVIQVWAERNGLKPCEKLPVRVDSLPSLLSLRTIKQIEQVGELRSISWNEFFAKFDQLGLTLVYDDSQTGYHEILQNEERSPYRSRTQDLEN